MKTMLFLFLATLVLTATGCGSSKLAPGRCEVNADCNVGFRCVKTYCEDIYYPDHTKRLP